MKFHKQITLHTPTPTPHTHRPAHLMHILAKPKKCETLVTWWSKTDLCRYANAYNRHQAPDKTDIVFMSARIVFPFYSVSQSVMQCQSSDNKKIQFLRVAPQTETLCGCCAIYCIKFASKYWMSTFQTEYFRFLLIWLRVAAMTSCCLRNRFDSNDGAAVWSWNWTS